MKEKTLLELKKEAATKNIRGRSKMNKAELCKALKYKCSPKNQLEKNQFEKIKL